MIFEHAVIALQPEAIEKARRHVAIHLVERCSRGRHLGQATGFAVFFVVGIEGEDQSAVVADVVRQLRAAGVEIVVAIRAEAVALAVIVIRVVTEITDRPARAGKILIEPVAPEEILGREGKRHIARWRFHDEVERAAGLRTKLQGRPGPNELDPFDRIEDGSVMGLRKTELLVLDRDPVFQDLHELTALGIQAAVTKVDDR